MGVKLALPRRELRGAGVHYAAAFGQPGALCGARGEVAQQTRVRRAVDCARCADLAAWVWSHRVGRGFGEARPTDEAPRRPRAAIGARIAVGPTKAD